jgi:phospholipid/cholesterol/gamma-HCH transport system substrate-binding protein
MSQKVSKFKVGVFVLIGVAMMLGSIVGLGTLRYFQPGRTYVTFFNESVQGLQRDSTVKYRGVEVGRVKDIRVGPDYKLIEVVMDIQFHGEPEQDMVAQLKTVGITGIVFVELDLKKPGDPDLSPRITFAAEYPIIPSKPSELTRVLSVIDKVTKEIDQIDFKAMADKIESVLDSTDAFVSDKRWKKLPKLLESSTKHLNSLLAKADGAVDKAELKGLVKSTSQLLTQANALLKEANVELKAMKLPATADKVNTIVDDVGNAGSEILQNIRITSENLQRASETLDQLLMRLRSSPSDLIFSTPPPPREGENP